MEGVTWGGALTHNERVIQIAKSAKSHQGRKEGLGEEKDVPGPSLLSEDRLEIVENGANADVLGLRRTGFGFNWQDGQNRSMSGRGGSRICPWFLYSAVFVKLLGQF